MDFLKQLGMLLRMNLLGVPQRLGLVCTTVIGVTCAVAVLISMLAMGVGARRAAMGNVRPDRASVLSVEAGRGPLKAPYRRTSPRLSVNCPGYGAMRERAGDRRCRRLWYMSRPGGSDSGNLVGFPHDRRRRRSH